MLKQTTAATLVIGVLGALVLWFASPRALVDGVLPDSELGAPVGSPALRDSSPDWNSLEVPRSEPADKSAMARDLEVLVVDCTGRGIGNCRISLLGTDQSESHVGTTDPSGRSKLMIDSSKSLSLEARAPDGRCGAKIHEARSDGATCIIELKSDAILVGRVKRLDLLAARLPKLQAFAWPAEMTPKVSDFDTPTSASVVQRIAIDSFGEFRFCSAKPGEVWMVAAGGSGLTCRPTSVDFAIGQNFVELELSELFGAVLVFSEVDGSSARGCVDQWSIHYGLKCAGAVPGGALSPESPLVAISGADPALLARRPELFPVLRLVGIGDPAPGLINCSGEMPGYSPYSVKFSLQPVESGLSTVQVELIPRVTAWGGLRVKLLGELVDALGAMRSPLPVASIRLEPIDGSKALRYALRELSSATYVFSDIPAGEYTAWFEPSTPGLGGGMIELPPVPVHIGSQEALVTLDLGGAGAIVVTSPNGKLSGGLRVSIAPIGSVGPHPVSMVYFDREPMIVPFVRPGAWVVSYRDPRSGKRRSCEVNLSAGEMVVAEPE